LVLPFDCSSFLFLERALVQTPLLSAMWNDIGQRIQRATNLRIRIGAQFAPEPLRPGMAAQPSDDSRASRRMRQVGLLLEPLKVCYRDLLTGERPHFAVCTVLGGRLNCVRPVLRVNRVGFHRSNVAPGRRDRQTRNLPRRHTGHARYGTGAVAGGFPAALTNNRRAAPRGAAHRYRGGVSRGQVDARLSDRRTIQTTRTRLRETFARLQARGAALAAGVGTAIRRALVERQEPTPARGPASITASHSPRCAPFQRGRHVYARDVRPVRPA